MSSSQRPSVRYSQNFLRDGRLADRLLDRSGISAGDLVIEIGPGKGAITERLAGRCRRVLAIEKDPELAARLQRRFAGSRHVTVVAGDFLDAALPAMPYKVFANIPFNVTAAVVTKLTRATCPPNDVYLAVQREAAGRFLGRPAETLCSVLLKPWFEPLEFHRFRREDFVPVPGVDVVMLRLHKRGPPLVTDADACLYRDFVTHAFIAWQPLDRLLANLLGRRQFCRVAARIALDRRPCPSLVRFEQWLALFDAFKASGGASHRKVDGAARRLDRQQARLHKQHRTRTSVGCAQRSDDRPRPAGGDQTGATPSILPSQRNSSPTRR